MSKELFIIDGRYFFVDDDTGKIYEAKVSMETVSEADQCEVIKAIMAERKK